MAQDLGLERAGALKHFPEFLLGGGLDESIAIARLPYRPDGATVADIEAWRRLGLVDGPPGAMVATERVKPLLQLMLATTRDVAASLWDAYPGVVDHATESVTQVIDEITDNFFVVAAAHRSLPLPEDRFQRLHRRLTTVRYARARAHVAAWRSKGLDRDEIEVLTALWHDGEVQPGPVVSALVDRGLVAADGSRLTAAGVELREAIEALTNATVEPIFSKIGEAERERLIGSLVVLPGEHQ